MVDSSGDTSYTLLNPRCEVIDVAKFDVFHEYGKELQERIRLRTFPLAVKMLAKESDIPEGAQRPKRDLGYRLATCQGFAMSRREGTLVAMTKEDMYCPESVLGYGMAEAPQFFLDGHQRYPQSVENLEAGSVWAHEFPRLEVGKYAVVVSAPLTTANFEPDVVIMYVDAVQLAVLLWAAASKEGHELTCPVSGKGACVYSVVKPIQTGNYQVNTPCGGDIRYAGAQHDEMVFSLPIGKMEDLLSSLRYLEGYGYRLPFRYVMHPEAAHSGNYTELAKMIGMDWMEGDEQAKYRK